MRCARSTACASAAGFHQAHEEIHKRLARLAHADDRDPLRAQAIDESLHEREVIGLQLDDAATFVARARNTTENRAENRAELRAPHRRFALDRHAPLATVVGEFAHRARPLNFALQHDRHSIAHLLDLAEQVSTRVRAGAGAGRLWTAPWP